MGGCHLVGAHVRRGVAEECGGGGYLLEIYLNGYERKRGCVLAVSGRPPAVADGARGARGSPVPPLWVDVPRHRSGKTRQEKATKPRAKEMNR